MSATCEVSTNAFFSTIFLPCSKVGVTWQRRKIHVTDSEILLSKVHGSTVLDQIPLAEVKSIRRQETIGTKDTLLRKSSLTSLGSFAFSMKERDLSTENILDDDAEGLLTFSIHTIEDGFNYGRITFLGVKDEDQYTELTNLLEEMVIIAQEKEFATKEKGWFARSRRKSRKIYNSFVFQSIVGVIIFASYITALVNAQILPEPGSHRDKIFTALEWFYNFSFTLVRAAPCLVDGMKLRAGLADQSLRTLFSRFLQRRMELVRFALTLSLYRSLIHPLRSGRCRPLSRLPVRGRFVRYERLKVSSSVQDGPPLPVDACRLAAPAVDWILPPPASSHP